MTHQLTIAVGLFVALQALGQPRAVGGMSDVLEIVDFSYSSGGPPPTLRVVNKAPKPVLAWGLEVNYVFADGSTKTSHLSTDLAPTLPLVGKVSAIGDCIGELGPGEGCVRGFGVPIKPPNGRPVNATVSPEFVIFSDNTVIGNETAADDIFQRRRALRDEYSAYLQSVRQLSASRKLEADLAVFRNDMKRGRAGENPLGRPGPDYSRVQMVYSQFANELEGVIGCMASKRQTPPECLANYIRSVELYRAVYAQHSERKGDAK